MRSLYEVLMVTHAKRMADREKAKLLKKQLHYFDGTISPVKFMSLASGDIKGNYKLTVAT